MMIKLRDLRVIFVLVFNLVLAFPAALFADTGSKQAEVMQKIAQQLAGNVTMKDMPAKLRLPDSEDTQYFFETITKQGIENTPAPKVQAKGEMLMIFFANEKPAELQAGKGKDQLILNGKTMDWAGLSPQQKVALFDKVLSETRGSKSANALQHLLLERADALVGLAIAAVAIGPAVIGGLVVHDVVARTKGPTTSETSTYLAMSESPVDPKRIANWNCDGNDVTRFSMRSKNGQVVNVSFIATQPAQMIVDSGSTDSICYYTVDRKAGKIFNKYHSECPGDANQSINSAFANADISPQKVVDCCKSSCREQVVVKGPAAQGKRGKRGKPAPPNDANAQ